MRETVVFAKNKIQNYTEIIVGSITIHRRGTVKKLLLRVLFMNSIVSFVEFMVLMQKNRALRKQNFCDRPEQQQCPAPLRCPARVPLYLEASRRFGSGGCQKFYFAFFDAIARLSLRLHTFAARRRMKTSKN